MRRLAFFLATTAIAVGGCASGGGAGGRPASRSFGYMVPGPTVANAIGLGAADTLPELPALTTLPTTLTTAIQQEVAQGRWADRCTRRFGGPTNYAVIFHRACDPGLGPESEPVAIVGFTSDGRTVGRIAWSGPGTVTSLVPARRF